MGTFAAPFFSALVANESNQYVTQKLGPTIGGDSVTLAVIQ